MLQEHESWILWLPVAFGVGIGGYFALPFEPSYWWDGTIIGVMIGLLWLWWCKPNLGFLLLSIAMIGMGFIVAHLRTDALYNPRLLKPLGYVELEATIQHIDIYPHAKRYLLSDLAMKDVLTAHTPKKLQLTVNTADDGITTGMRVSLDAILFPSPEAVLPYAYDAAFRHYFQEIGGVGYAVSAIKEVTTPMSDFVATTWLSQLRTHIATRILTVMDVPYGGVAVALMVGNKTSIPPPVMEAIRDSGLAHLLSISGMHLALVASLCFLGIRMLLLCSQTIALYYPIKKWAAFGAIIGSFGYLCIAGMPISAIRAFIMTSLFLMAILLDRNLTPLRSVALAAFIVLILQPESLLSPSFQMSFSAVIALISAYEYGQRFTSTQAHRYWLYSVAKAIIGILISSLVAGAATAPFAIYHFHHHASYGAIANLVAIPLTSLWIMPWAVLAFILMPMGVEALALLPMEWGLTMMIHVADKVAALPYATQIISFMPARSLVAISVGGLWLCLWQTSWRLAGLLFVIIGIIITWVTPLPDVIIDGQAQGFAVKERNNIMVLSDTAIGRYKRKTWQHMLGQDRLPLIAPSHQDIRCDGVGCVYHNPPHRLLFITDPIALKGACNSDRVTMIINLTFHNVYCNDPDITVLSRFDLWRNGGYMLWLEDALTMQSVRSFQGNRPWNF